jgi:hypothetical protein
MIYKTFKKDKRLSQDVHQAEWRGTAPCTTSTGFTYWAMLPSLRFRWHVFGFVCKISDRRVRFSVMRQAVGLCFVWKVCVIEISWRGSSKSEGWQYFCESVMDIDVRKRQYLRSSSDRRLTASCGRRWGRRWVEINLLFFLKRLCIWCLNETHYETFWITSVEVFFLQQFKC